MIVITSMSLVIKSMFHVSFFSYAQLYTKLK